MQTFQDYLSKTEENRRPALLKLRETIRASLPAGFEETFSYGMPSFVVPLSLYPQGYHCKSGTPLPFISYASQKGFIGFYHMGLYASPELYTWFNSNWDSRQYGKPDMGKSCIRFRKTEKIPYELIAELCKKMTATQWIAVYEKIFKKVK